MKSDKKTVITISMCEQAEKKQQPPKNREKRKSREKTCAEPVSPNTVNKVVPVETDSDVFTDALQGLFGNKDFSLQMLEKLPFPIGVFSAAGTLVFINPAFREVYDIQDNAQIVGKYNLLYDPLCFVEPGPKYRKLFHRAFKGEIIKCFIPSPIEPPVDIENLEKGIIPEPDVIERCFHPVWDGKKLAFVVSVFIVDQKKCTTNSKQRKEKNL